MSEIYSVTDRKSGEVLDSLNWWTSGTENFIAGLVNCSTKHLLWRCRGQHSSLLFQVQEQIYSSLHSRIEQYHSNQPLSSKFIRSCSIALRYEIALQISSCSTAKEKEQWYCIHQHFTTYLYFLKANYADLIACSSAEDSIKPSMGPVDEETGEEHGNKVELVMPNFSFIPFYH